MKMELKTLFVNDFKLHTNTNSKQLSQGLHMSFWLVTINRMKKDIL